MFEDFKEVKPDCYCLGGDIAHYRQEKYARAVAKISDLQGECNLLADVLRDAYEVVKTIEGEDSDEADKLAELRMSIEYALAAYDERRISTANVRPNSLP